VFPLPVESARYSICWRDIVDVDDSARKYYPHSAFRNPQPAFKKKKKKKKKKNEKNGQKTRQCRAQSKHDILTKDLNNVAKNFENEWY
jgi:hypothetical protein